MIYSSTPVIVHTPFDALRSDPIACALLREFPGDSFSVSIVEMPSHGWRYGTRFRRKTPSGDVHTIDVSNGRVLLLDTREFYDFIAGGLGGDVVPP